MNGTTVLTGDNSPCSYMERGKNEVPPVLEPSQESMGTWGQHSLQETVVAMFNGPTHCKERLAKRRGSAEREKSWVHGIWQASNNLLHPLGSVDLIDLPPESRCCLLNLFNISPSLGNRPTTLGEMPW